MSQSIQEEVLQLIRSQQQASEQDLEQIRTLLAENTRLGLEAQRLLDEVSRLQDILSHMEKPA